VYTATDGVNWVSQFDNYNVPQLYTVIGNGNKILISGTAGSLITSMDGTTFNVVSGFTWEDLQWMVSTKSGMVILGQYYVYTSPDGVNWTSNALSFQDAQMLRTTAKPVYSTTLHLLATCSAGYGAVPAGVLTSSDGVNWRYKQMSATGVTAIPTGFLVTSDMGIYSYDGQTWTQIGDQSNLMFPLYTSNQVIAVAQSTEYQIMVSLDIGKTWNLSSYNGDCNVLGPAVSNGYVVVFAGGSGCVLSSPIANTLNGWTVGTLGISPVDLIVTPTQFVTINSQGQIVTSADGVNWYSTGNVPSTYSTTGMAFTTQIFVIGDKGAIFAGN
jgi:hypothetical protein